VKIYPNHAAICDFTWLMQTIDASDGIHIMDAKYWDESQANLTIYCDVSLEGLGFITPALKAGLSGTIPPHMHLQTIFYFESLCMASAILWASGIEPTIRRLLIFTDSLNCVEMFNSLKAQDGYNDILLFVMRILITMGISLRIFHIPGVDNITADALSRNLLGAASSSLPSLNIHLFQPPREALGRQE